MKKPTKKTSKDNSPAKSESKNHGNAVDFQWEVLEAMLPFDPSCRYCAHQMGISTDTIEKYLRQKHNMTFLEYKELFLEDSAWLIKRSVVSKAQAGNIEAAKYALGNISQWKEKREVSVEDITDRELMESVAQLLNQNKVKE